MVVVLAIVLLLVNTTAHAALDAGKVNLICPFKTAEKLLDESQNESYPRVMIASSFENLEHDAETEYRARQDYQNPSPTIFPPAQLMSPGLLKLISRLAICPPGPLKADAKMGLLDDECRQFDQVVERLRENEDAEALDLLGPKDKTLGEMVILRGQRPMIFIVANGTTKPDDFKCKFDQLAYEPRSHMLAHRHAYVRARALLPSIVGKLCQMREEGDDPDDYQYVFTGYDFGGSVAQVLARMVYNDSALDFRSHGGIENSANQVIEVTFGSPNVIAYGQGKNTMLRNLLRACNSVHIVAANDLVASSLPFLWPSLAIPVVIPAKKMIKAYKRELRLRHQEDPAFKFFCKIAETYYHLDVPEDLLPYYHGAFGYLRNSVASFFSARAVGFRDASVINPQAYNMASDVLSLIGNNTHKLSQELDLIDPNKGSTNKALVAITRDSGEVANIGPEVLVKETRPKQNKRVNIETELDRLLLERGINMATAAPSNNL